MLALFTENGRVFLVALMQSLNDDRGQIKLNSKLSLASFQELFANQLSELLPSRLINTHG